MNRISDPKITVENLRKQLKTYLITYPNIRTLILGVSGGVDSALVAALALPVCKELGVQLRGYSLPTTTNTQHEILRADAVGKYLCTEFKELSLDTYMEYFLLSMFDSTENSFDTRVRRGNIKARLRMLLLYDFAQQGDGLVLSTDNLTEYYLGFWTLHGDVGDLGLIQNLWKTEVYALANYIADHEYKDIQPDKWDALKVCIDAIPTDGNGVSGSDLDQIGVNSYAEVDAILSAWVNEHKGDETHAVIQRYERTKFKRTNPYNVTPLFTADNISGGV